jgi:sugar lactone lactonase YvrE
LRELEERYADRLVVIGVHTAKFPAERDARHLQAAVQRLEIEHPVVNDRDFSIWQSYAVRAWPTVMFVDPEGKVIGRHEGEFTADMLAPVLEAAFAEFEREQLLQPGAMTGLRPPAQPDSLLAFPGKAVANAALGRLFIADTNHNRVVVATLEGDVVRFIGSGVAGFTDGPLETARLHHPLGLALDGDVLYVADTGNHSIRRVDLQSGRVTTVAGTGSKADRPGSGGPALETPLRSPWDLAVVDGTLYVAMAGNHQLWAHRLGSEEIRRFAGSGHEGLRDEPLPRAWLAQPSGIDAYHDGRALLFTDSETSSVRVASLTKGGDGMATTLAGEDLFEFGDVDGGPDVARLQHPLGVAWHEASATIYVADTYNNKVKRLDPRTGVVTTWLGDGEPGHRDGAGSAARFFEPAGLSVTDDALWIADTNNHAIRRADLTTGEVRTVELRGL